MARRTRNRMELRDQYDAAERRKDEEETDEEEEEEGDDEEEGEEEEEGAAPAADAADDEEGEGDVEEGDEDDEEAPKKKKKKPKPKVVKPKTRTRTAKVIRMRVVWGVFNNSHQCVATYEYPRRAEADQHAVRLTTDKRQTHFVQPVKEPIEEKKDKEK
jgi:cobalamin biosynthesis protein CobT